MTRLRELLRNGVADVAYYMSLHEGGGKGGGSAPAPIYTPPPAAPAPSEEATLEEAVTPEEEETQKREAQKKGAKSLQIPLAAGGDGSSSVGML